MDKHIIIPLTNIRDIKMRFKKINENQWECVASDDFLKDIEIFFKSGYYELDKERQVTIVEE